MAKRTGIYPGTFDPITYGHLDIVGRGVKLVDELIIGVTTNPQKAPFFSADERVAQIERETAVIAKESGVPITVEAFEGLLVNFAASRGAGVVIRGLRAVSDFEYEFQMAGMNYALNPEVETAFLMADARLQSISSRLVKEIAAFGGDISSFVPERVAEDVQQKMKR